MGSEKESSVVAGDHALGPPIAAPDLVLQRSVWVGPFAVDERVAVKEACDVLKPPSSVSKIVRGKSVAVADRLDCPAAGAAPDPLVAVKLCHGAQEFDAAFDFRKSIDDRFDGKGIGANVGAPAQELNDVSTVAQKDVLCAIDRLQKRPLRREIAERENAPKTGIAYRADVGSHDSGEIFRPPEDVCVKAVVSGIGEKNRAPTPRRADIFVAPDTTWSRPQG